jgi:hypothetical protein
MRTPHFLVFATLAAAATPACGTASNFGPAGGSTGGSPAATVTSDFPIGVLSVCGATVWLGDAQGSYGGQASVALSEDNGIVSAVFDGSDGMIVSGTVKFQVGTATTAFALPGQSFLAGAVSLTSTTVSSGSLALVDGNVVLSLASATGVGQAWFSCEVPYAGCDAAAADPTADLATATYGNCLPPNAGAPPSVTLTRTGGAVSAAFSAPIQLGTASPFSSLDFTVVAPGTATTTRAVAAGTPAVCGDGLDGTIMVDGDSLFLSVGEDWDVGAFLCTKVGS